MKRYIKSNEYHYKGYGIVNDTDGGAGWYVWKNDELIGCFDTDKEAEEHINSITSSKNESVCSSKSMNSDRYSIREWYIYEFPEDDLGEEIDEFITFKDAYRYMKLGKDIYDLLGVDDSIIRERVFSELAKRENVSYDDIYYLWLRGE